MGPQHAVVFLRSRAPCMHVSAAGLLRSTAHDFAAWPELDLPANRVAHHLYDTPHFSTPRQRLSMGFFLQRLRRPGPPRLYASDPDRLGPPLLLHPLLLQVLRVPLLREEEGQAGHNC